MHIDVKPIAVLNKYELRTPVIIEGIKIPAGFMWDGASIPRFVWPLVGSPFEPRFMVASMVHDYLYCTPHCSRRRADEIFKRLLLANHVDCDTAKMMHAAVRLGGGLFWKG